MASITGFCENSTLFTNTHVACTSHFKDMCYPQPRLCDWGSQPCSRVCRSELPRWWRSVESFVGKPVYQPIMRLSITRATCAGERKGGKGVQW